MTDLLALADRIAAATGPSLDLDLDILNVLDGGGWERGGFTPNSATRSYGDGLSERILCPLYTSSLAAITAAIEERLPGWGWSAGRPEGQSWGQGFVGRHERPHVLIRKDAATPALALCEALIRALAGEASNG